MILVCTLFGEVFRTRAKMHFGKETSSTSANEVVIDWGEGLDNGEDVQPLSGSISPMLRSKPSLVSYLDGGKPKRVSKNKLF